MPSKTAYALAGVGALYVISQRKSGNRNTTTAVGGQQNTLRITRESNAFRQYSRPYSVTVTGGIRPVGNVELSKSDGLDGSTATGHVTDGSDTFVFTGDIEEISTGEGLTATVNGVPV